MKNKFERGNQPLSESRQRIKTIELDSESISVAMELTGDGMVKQNHDFISSICGIRSPF